MFVKPLSTQFEKIFLAIAIASYFVVVTYSSSKLSPTYDEPIHIRSGITMLTVGKYLAQSRAWWAALDPFAPPGDVLPAAIALAAGANPDYSSSPHTAFNFIRAGRYANHLIGVAILLIIYCWARRLSGGLGAAIAVITLLATPTFLAHSSIISTDLYMAFGALLLCYLLWCRVLTTSLEPSKTTLLLIALVFSVTVAFKASNLIFAGIIPLAFAYKYLFQHGKLTLSLKNLWRSISMSSITVGLGLLLAATIYHFAYLSLTQTVVEPLFKDSLPKLAAFDFTLKLRNIIALASALGPTNPPAYFCGSLQPGAWWQYLVILLGRTPEALLLLYTISVFAAVKSTLGSERSGAHLVLALFAGAVWIFFTTQGFYSGLRHLLFPLLILPLVTSVLANTTASSKSKHPLSLYVILFISFTQTVITTPFQISYVNTLAKNRLTFTSDADWGQGLIALREWQEKNSPESPIWLSYFGNSLPEEFGVEYFGLFSPLSPTNPSAGSEIFANPTTANGYIAISATNLAGRYSAFEGKSPDYFYSWLSKKPVEIVAGSIYIYRAESN